MLQVLKFILMQVIHFMQMLFTIDLGDNLNLGLLMCIIFIFLPMMLRVINFLKMDAMEELNNAYEESRPRETFSFTRDRSYDAVSGRVSDFYNLSEGTHWRARHRRGREHISRRYK